MSYCVNCGVELDKTRASCPLCNTVVYNPNQPVDRTSPTPYPKEEGKSEHVDHKELVSLVSIVFATISVVCGVLNWLVFTTTHWSYYIIGGFAMLWVLLLPVFYRDKVSPFVSLVLNGISVALYVGMVSILHPGQGWYMEIALPIIFISTVLLEVFYLLNVRLKTSAITKLMVIVAIIAIITVAVQTLIGFHVNRYINLTWSAIVLACCIALEIILFALTLHKGARNELRKRMHF